LFTASVIVLLAVHGAYHYRSLASQLEARQTATLGAKLATVQSRLAHHQSADLLAGSVHDLMEVVTGHSDLFLVIRDSAGRILAASHAEHDRPALPASARSGTVDSSWRTGQQTFRVMRIAAAIGAARMPASTELTFETTGDSHILRAFVREVALGMIVGVLIAGILAYLITSRGLLSLNRFARLANDITVSRLDQRLEPKSVPLELRELAAAYNGMLARLATSFRRLVDFSADLAHELRTPIHNLLGQTQVALSRARSPDEYRRVLEANVEEYERLSRMIRDMLFLAQADNAQLPLSRETVQLLDVASKVASLFEAAADERRISIAIRGHGSVAADRLMLERALGNLLSNALHHAAPDSRIQIEIEPMPKEVSLTVANQGKPIPPDIAARLFDRFYRGDASRHGEGAGLGLAIVKSIVELHGGAVGVASEPMGETRFTLHIPVGAKDGGIEASNLASSSGAQGPALVPPQRVMGSAPD
jgi:two-component system, OmpR family, heavy metal sensor histidine kinase CusS